MYANKWIKGSAGWYYLGVSGAMATNSWVWSSGKCYYLTESGLMAANTVVDGKYYVDANGAWDGKTITKPAESTGGTTTTGNTTTTTGGTTTSTTEKTKPNTTGSITDTTTGNTTTGSGSTTSSTTEKPKPSTGSTTDGTTTGGSTGSVTTGDSSGSTNGIAAGGTVSGSLKSTLSAGDMVKPGNPEPTNAIEPENSRKGVWVKPEVGYNYYLDKKTKTHQLDYETDEPTGVTIEQINKLISDIKNKVPITEIYGKKIIDTKSDFLDRNYWAILEDGTRVWFNSYSDLARVVVTPTK